MSDRKLAFLACPLRLEDPQPSLAWLSGVSETPLGKHAVQFIAVNTKFSAPRGVRSFNVEANYPVELARIATHAHWSEGSGAASQAYRDARGLFCLHRFVGSHPEIERVVLFVAKLGKDADQLADLSEGEPQPFSSLESKPPEGMPAKSGPILFDRLHPDAETALTLALDIALNGAIYGIVPYSLQVLLDQSMRAAALVNRNMPSREMD